MRRQYHARKVGGDRLIWDGHRLIRLSKPLTVAPVPLSEISEIDENWWYEDPNNLPTPRSLAAHMALARSTDPAHPILLCADGRLMDGMHGVVKALLEDRTQVLAVRFPVTPDPDYINASLDDLPYSDEAL